MDKLVMSKDRVAVTVTDIYWVKDADSDLRWEDVRFKKDCFPPLR